MNCMKCRAVLYRNTFICNHCFYKMNHPHQNPYVSPALAQAYNPRNAVNKAYLAIVLPKGNV